MTKFLSFFIFLSLITSFSRADFSIIPHPEKITKTSGVFIFSKKVGISGDSSLDSLINNFKTQLSVRTAFSLSKSTNRNNINLTLSNKIKKGAYRLEINKENIRITALNQEGLFYGLMSLLQLIETSSSKSGKVFIPCMNIEDSPRYEWRGFMLDEARHFFGIEKVKQLLDWMAYYKLNKFHWHLTDAQGWRLQIKKYPKLTEIGGIGNYTDPNAPAKFYTQDQIKEIVAYAKARFITVIPEIDMPGHATAANKAYPEFNGGGSEEYPDFTFNPGYERTYQFLSDILKETDSLFPSKMIHLGGDEVSFGAKAWETNKDVLSLMDRKSLKNIKEVEQYFFERMADTVKALGSRVLAWDEAIEANLDPKYSLFFWWRHDKPQQLEMAINKGYEVILCPRLPLYFDFVQDSTHTVGRKWVEKYNKLSDIYNFPSGNSLYENTLVRGVQANLWTETIHNEKRFDFMIFPRIAALAEAAWTSSSNKNFENFSNILTKHLTFYKKQKINYYNPILPIESK